MKLTHVVTGCSVLLALMFGSSGGFCADDVDIAKLFHDRGLTGTMIVSSLDGKTEYVYNAVRSATRSTPASTFKILNTLIALEEGVIKDEKEVIKWDGKDKGFDAWNKDQTLESALPLSCVWFYQELARRIGNERYVAHLKKVGYGNEKTGPDVTTFWLEGDLKISAREQIDLLKGLYRETLPYRKANLTLLKKLLIVDENPGFTIRAKTGWAQRTSPQQGWYVGYAETKEGVWFFATNFEIVKESDERFRKEISLAALKAKGIL